MRHSLAAAVVLGLFCSSALAGKITTDPNAPGAPETSLEPKPDPRLAQKLTYKVRLKPMTTILRDLSEQTGVRFVAGRTVKDWRVREDCATIHATDIPLANLMDSIARVMKFAWIKGGVEPNWTYRLVEDQKAIRRVKDREARWLKLQAEKRRVALDELLSLESMSEKQLSKLREDRPDLYLLAKSGLRGPRIEFLRAAPEVTNAWLEGRELKLKAPRLPPEAFAALRTLTKQTLDAHALAHPDDQSFAQMLDSLDDDLAKATVTVHGGSPHSPYGCIDAGVAFLSIRRPETDRDKLLETIGLRAFEEKRPFTEVYREMRDQLRRFPQPDSRERLWNYTMEEYLVNEDQPYLHDKIKKKIDSKTRSGLAFQLAEATALSVVTDDFRGRTGSKAEEESEVGKALDSVGEAHGLNWQRRDDVIELWDRDWYRRREARVSKAWLEAKRKKLEDIGTLDLDDLAEIAALTDDQLNKNIPRDRALRVVAQKVRQFRDYLKLYGSFSAEQKAFLFSAGGLGFGALRQAQQQAVLKIVAGMEVPLPEGMDIGRVGLFVRMARSKQDRAYVYTITAYTALGPIPGRRIFSTPVYVKPQSREKP